MYVHPMYAVPMKPGEGIISPRNGVIDSCELFDGVLGTGPWSFRRAAWAFNHRASTPALAFII